MRPWRYFKDFILSYYYPNGKYFIISFPNSGRSWLIYMIKCILKEIKNNDLQIENSHDFSEIIIEDGTRQDPNLLFKFIKRYKYLRANVIFLCRDPRDVISSNYYQVTNRAKNPFIFKDKSEFITHEVFGFKRVIHFYNLWFRNKSIPKKFLLIKYENLLGGLDELKKTLIFLNIDAPDTLIEKIYNQSNAELMRKKEINKSIDEISNFGNSINKLKVRKAIKGSYLNELSHEDIKYCNKEMLNLNKYFNYKI